MKMPLDLVGFAQSPSLWLLFILIVTPRQPIYTEGQQLMPRFSMNINHLHPTAF
jgi:hypothetical protein